MMQVDGRLWGRFVGRKTRGVVDAHGVGHGIVVGEGRPIEGADKGIKVFGSLQRQSPKQDGPMLGSLGDTLVAVCAHHAWTASSPFSGV